MDSLHILFKKDLKDEAVSSIALFSIIIASGCIGLLWMFGDPLMRFLGYPQLGSYIKITGIMLVFNAINGVLTGILSKQMQFGKMFFRTLIVLPLSAIVCIILMLYGMELEALIAYNVVNPFLTTIFLTLLLKSDIHRFSFGINIRELKELASI